MGSSERSVGVLALGLALLALAAGCGGSSGESDEGGSASGTPIKTITINETEFQLQPSSVTVSEPGTYEFKAVNKGTVTHALELEGHGVEAETDSIDPGDSATLKVDLEDSGSYELYCPVGDHEDRGMKGSVVVGSASGSSGSSTNEDSDDSSSGY